MSTTPLEDMNYNAKVAPCNEVKDSTESIKVEGSCPTSSTSNTRSNQNQPQRVAVDVDEGKPMLYCKLVVKRPKLTFGIGLGVHILLLLLTAVLFATGYDILPIDFEGVPLALEGDPTKTRTDAWWYASDDSAVTTLTGGQQLRGVQYQAIQMVYEIKDGNIFTRENLVAIKKSEDELFNNTEYQNKLCQLQGSINRKCKLPLSILRFFDGSYKSIDPVLNDPTFQDIPTVLLKANSINTSKVILNYHLGKNAVVSKTAVSSSHTRSLLYIGWPSEGYNSTEDRNEDQIKEIDKTISDTFASRLNAKYEDKIGKMNFYYDNLALSTDALQKQVIFDMMLAVASFIFIFIFMWAQTGSLWLTSWGIFGIVSSFNITNIIYRVIFDYRYIGIFHVLSIFIILGIGSDNVFVFMDTWKQSEKEKHESLEKRLSEVYKRAAKATLITSFTTIIAFLSNVPSPLLAISSFGLFSAVLVFVNYLSVVLFFPTVIIVHHISRQGRCCCGPMCGKPTTETEFRPESQENLAAAGETKKTISEHIISFFEGWFFRNIIAHKIIRWVVIGIFVCIIGVSIGFATQLGPDEEQVNLIIFQLFFSTFFITLC